MASLIYCFLSLYIHGSVTVLSVLVEWMEKRGWKMPFCTQRTNSSPSGAGPKKPPMSQPWLDTPQRAMPKIVAMLYFRVSQQVRLSPAQTCAYRWMPA